MEVVHEYCCGLDVHKDIIVAVLLTPGKGAKPTRELRTFGAFTHDIREMAAWLSEAGCTDVAMESTGSYWKPVYNLLEERFKLLITNAYHLKSVPGRKRDVKDAEWIAQLHRHGLLRPSFIPDKEQRELRELTRYRTTLTRERAAEVNRIQKVLEGANIKLGSVVSDVLGVSGREMLEQLVRGAYDPQVLATLARGTMRKKKDALEAALEGLVEKHQRFMLREQLQHVDELDARIGRLEAEIEERLGEENLERELLDGIPGVARAVAEGILAEVGPSVEHFENDRAISSWAGVCPGMNESAGKNKSGKAPKGNKHLRALLVQAAHGLRGTNSFLGALYRRLAARMGVVKAALAVAHRILRIAYHVLKEKTPYRELGADYHDERTKERTEKRHTKALERLGYQVTLTAVGKSVA